MACITLCQAAGFIGTVFTTPSIPTWYAGLNKPSINPPNWLFAPVWTTLFLLMGVSLYLVWDKGSSGKRVRKAVAFFILQLTVNTLWSVAFFGTRSPLRGLTVIIILWALILATIKSFSKISRTASLLLYPYLLWVSYATVLNYLIFKLNP